jgi:hypothetical protein
MTIIASYICDGRVWIASDSIGSNDLTKHDFGSKIITINESYYVGFSASYRIADLIREHKDFPKEIYDISDARSFRDSLRQLAINDGCCDRASAGETLNHPISVLIASRSGMYLIDSDYQLHRFVKDRSYHSVGSGSVVGLGVLFLAAQLKINGDIAVQHAVLGAIEHVPGCGGVPYVASIEIKKGN